MPTGRPLAVTSVLFALTLLVAGCLGDPAVTLQGATALPGGDIQVVDGAGAPVAHPVLTLLDSKGAPLTVLSGDANGTLTLPAAPLSPASGIVAAPGYAPSGPLAWPLPDRVALTPEDPAVPVAADDPAPLLRMLKPLDFGGAYLADATQTCEVNNCGMSEPVIEVAGDGSIYISGVCCVGRTPPVFVSRDGGSTWQEFSSPVRDRTGIEGDFAVDDAGNVYFTDILVGAGWFTSWDKDGNERYTIPVPFKPLVDRPWVRAGAEDVVYFLYNTGFSTEFHRSTNGGLTWSTSLKSFPFALGNLGQGPDNEHLLVVGGSPLQHFETFDGGTTWSDGETVPTPKEGNRRNNPVPVADEAGHVHVAYQWTTETNGTRIYVSHRSPDGAWDGPHLVSPQDVGSNDLAWAAAGRNGTLSLAWYGSPGEPASPDDVAADRPWYLYAAASVDATSGAPHFQTIVADPEPVLKGPLGRRLLDFLQLDVSPDGALHIAYAANRGTGSDEHMYYVRSTTGLQLQPQVFPFGPSAAAGAEGDRAVVRMIA